MLHDLLRFALDRHHELWLATRTHIALSLGAVAIAALIGIPLGVWTARHDAGRSVVGFVSALRVIPSLAILALVLPLLGIGFAPALLALIILACPPIIINTDVAFRSIDPSIREAGIGMGMGPDQLLRRVETPLAFPVVLAGMRTSTVEVIASATLAAFIGGGGLGDFILNGLANNDVRELLLGGVAVALLALLAESCLSLVVRAARRRVGGLGGA